MTRAQIEALLVGLPLPASRDAVLAYAREQPGGERAAGRLEQIPDRLYESIPEVGEELEPVQPATPAPRVEPPRAESGDPPGGPAYVGEPVEPPNVQAYKASSG